MLVIPMSGKSELSYLEKLLQRYQEALSFHFKQKLANDIAILRLSTSVHAFTIFEFGAFV